MVGGAGIEPGLYRAYEARQFTRTVPSIMAGTVGLEPTTTRLTAECSTIELHTIMAEDGVPDTHSLTTAIRLASGAETLSVHLPCGQGDWT